MARPGALRWALDTARWTPAPEELEFLLALIPEDEREQVRKFRFLEDQKRALASRLLQRRAAQLVLGIPHDLVVIRRTKGNKPYVANDLPKHHAPNFNFSVSHEVGGPPAAVVGSGGWRHARRRRACERLAAPACRQSRAA
jgi:4'-phosphopantetheinyl transferase